MTEHNPSSGNAEWDEVTPPRANEPKPPPWPVIDCRTPECKHDAPTAGNWGQPGERQRRCIRCRLWIWDREWWPEVGSVDG